MHLVRLLCVMTGLVGVSWSRTVPVSVPVSAFTWPLADNNSPNNVYQQSSLVDDLGYPVTDNPGRIEPRQGLLSKDLGFGINGVEYVDDLTSLSGGNDNILFFAGPEAPPLNAPKFTGRSFKKPSIILMNVVVNNTNANNNTQVTESTTAAATRMGDFVPAGFYRAPVQQSYMPMQYFRTHQDQSQIYGWNDLALFGGGISGGGGLPRVPLVPISLPNNQVGYVPLNLRMFRQLANGLPIRENAQQTDEVQQQQQQQQQQNQQMPDESNDDDQEDDVPLSMLSLQSDDTLIDSKPNPTPIDSTLLPNSGTDNFNLLGQRLRSQRPMLAVRNPFQAFAKNMNIRRVQYV